MSHVVNLRGLRARWCLSQDELADLLGIDRTRISRYEMNAEIPSLATALAIQVIFDEAPRAVFHRTYEWVEEAVMERAAKLERSLDGATDPRSLKKLALLDSMMVRATNNPGA